jgi:hypothetical protein
MVFENRVLRSILSPKRHKIIAGWRMLHNEELHNLHSSPIMFAKNKIGRMKWAARTEDRTTMCAGFCWKARRKKKTSRKTQMKVGE